MEEKTKLKKTKEWFENKTIFVVIAIVLIAVVGIAQLLKASNTIKTSVEDLTKQETPSSASTDNEQHTIQLSGKIVDEKNRPISSALIEVVELIGVSSYSDNVGNFILKSTVKKQLTNLELLVSKSNYETFVQKMVNENFDELSLGRIILKPIKKKSPKVVKKKTPRQHIDQTKKEPTQQIENKGNDNDVILENNTINGNVINNPTGTINIENNFSTPKDTTQND